MDRTRQLLINMDAPEHTMLRALVSDSFGPTAVRGLQDSVRFHSRSLVNRLIEMGLFDLVTNLSAELPLLVLADLLGMPREDWHLFYQWSNNIVGFDDPEFGGGNVERYQKTFAEAFLYARDMAVARRRRPSDDLTSKLVRCEIEGRRLGDAEFCWLWILLLIGGNESTRHFLSGSLYALAQWPDERWRLATDASLLATAVEELLRWVSPVMQFRRTATRDVDLEDQKIKEGEKVVLYYVSANRDEEIFEAPDRLDLGRKPNPHLSFGIGPHFCLGAHLARLEARTLLEELLPHLTKLELRSPIVRLQSNFMNGIKSLPAAFVS
jgi:cytochrome P450